MCELWVRSLAKFQQSLSMVSKAGASFARSNRVCPEVVVTIRGSMHTRRDEAVPVGCCKQSLRYICRIQTMSTLRPNRDGGKRNPSAKLPIEHCFTGDSDCLREVQRHALASGSL